MGIDDFVYNNEEEAEMGQIHAIHHSMNAIARVQARLAKQAQQPSAEECEECGDTIPEARRTLLPGVQLCVICQSRQERNRNIK